MDNLIIGQYIKGNSWLHKLDPRIKIVSMIIIFVSIFLIKELEYMIYINIFILFIVLTSRIPIIKMLNGLKSILFLLIFTFFIHVSNGQGDILFEDKLYFSLSSIGLIIISYYIYKFIKIRIRFKFLLLVIYFLLILLILNKLKFIEFFNVNFVIYEEGLLSFLFIFFRIISVIILSSLLTFTTMNNDLNNGLESLLKPIKIFKLNPGTFSMIFSITLRSIPTLLDESTRIMKAQASRGVDFSESSLNKKVNQIISLLIPMFVIALKRSEDLAYAMEVRGYIIGGKRTKLDEIKIKLKDILILFLVLLLFGGVIWTSYFIN